MAGVQLRPYQEAAVNRMHNGCILCGSVGSGKSRTGLAYYYIYYGGQVNTPEYVPMHNPPDLYIITTAKKRDDLEWEQEMLPFFMSTHDDQGLYSHHVTVDSWNNIKKYARVENSFFIFDEQRVVGYGTWAKSFLKIARHNRWILLSATPGDKYEDYMAVFIANGFYRNKTEFNKEHIIFSYYSNYPKVEGYKNTGRLNRLRRKILVDMDYHRRVIVRHSDIWCEYDKAQYKDIVRTRWNPIKQAPIENASEFCYLLRQCVNSDQSREVALLEIHEQHKRIIIFYSFDYELEILRCLAESNSIPFAEWNGHKHQPIPETEKWLYFVNYNAGSEGWNCILTNCMVFWSQNYSYKITKQAAGRIDRANTPYDELYYYHFKSRSGIDLAISKALDEKRKFNELRFVNF